ncbi:histone-lysine N-methyltransferase SETMAR [Trichonephila clavipes]|nr:histone-lysine N-methyltransferase SETMAR [Trichonephila clavipes]
MFCLLVNFHISIDERFHDKRNEDDFGDSDFAFLTLFNSRLSIFDVKDAPRTGKHVIENVTEISEIIEVDRHASSRSIPQKLKIYHKTVLNHLLKVGFKKKLDVWNNARSHTSVLIPQNLWERGWEVLMHPPNSPVPVPSDYQLFLALQNFLSDKKLGSREYCENRLLEFFAKASMKEAL